VETGVLYRWGKLVPGREQLGVDLFMEVSEYFAKKLEKGVLTYFEPFFFQTSDLEAEAGFFIIKGPLPEIFGLMEDEKYLALVTKAAFVVDHFQIDYLTVGERIPVAIERSAKIRAELGIV
jgi:hypothetical protein